MPVRRQNLLLTTPVDSAARREAILDLLHEMSDLGMRMARNDAAEVLEPEAPLAPEPTSSCAFKPARAIRPADPHLAFARVTRAVRQAVALELRIAEGTFARTNRYVASNPNRAKLQKALHAAAAAEPNRAARTELCRHIDERLDAELRDDPGAEMIDTLESVAEQLGLTLDYEHLPDELLGLDPPSSFPEQHKPQPPHPS